MEHITHYLKLAYLAEISIVFNLAYIELKWKPTLNAVKKKMGRLESLVPSAINKLICGVKNCDKCFNNEQHIETKFHRDDADFLNEVAIALSDRQNNMIDTSLFKKAWSFSDCGSLKYIIWLFHSIIRNEDDRKVSIVSLSVATFILVFITLVDLVNDTFTLPSSTLNIINMMGIWSSMNIWASVLFFLLVISIFLPCFFWILWRKFLKEYECLYIQLSKAYQIKTKKRLKDIEVEIERGS